ncbi:carbohydrate ABC transporter permease [Nonomuraea sp. NPDC050536]|uniref:carbohydrate ABC transporter permease n=1 Tax=Nonomuraea sp. NPDC050536 TaxID=3364366 RepID=UPI0037CC84D9
MAGFLLPPLALYGVFVLSPYAQAFYVALTDWQGFSARRQFVGLANFGRLLHDDLFWTGLKHNLVMLVVLPVVTLGLGLSFASLLNLGRIRGARFYKVVYFFPQVLSIAIIAVLWQFVYTPRSGLLNRLLGTDHAWLGDPRTALPAVMAVMVWSSVGFYVVLFSAAMQAIPRDIYEAAALDGSSGFTTFFRITLPLLSDTVRVGFVYLAIAALDGFAIVQIMTNGPGGPDNATEVVGLTLYRRAFTDGDFGYATAMGVVLLFLTLTLAVVAQRVAGSRR